jgi:hypothetical protein
VSTRAANYNAKVIVELRASEGRVGVIVLTPLGGA